VTAEWLKREISVARAHLSDFDSGATVRHNGADVTDAWRSEYVRRITEMEAILDRQDKDAE